MKFIANTSFNEKHTLKIFEVPDELFDHPDCDYRKKCEIAGWYYMNHIDLLSCTGPYVWSIIPYDLFEELKSEVYRGWIFVGG